MYLLYSLKLLIACETWIQTAFPTMCFSLSSIIEVSVSTREGVFFQMAEIAWLTV